MSICPPGRDDPNVLAALGISDKQHLAQIQPEQAYPLFAIIFALIDPFDRERIEASEGGLIEANSVLDEISGGLILIPLEACLVY